MQLGPIFLHFTLRCFSYGFMTAAVTKRNKKCHTPHDRTFERDRVIPRFIVCLAASGCLSAGHVQILHSGIFQNNPHTEHIL